MVVFTDSVVAAVSCAMDMQAGMAALDADDLPRLYVGISHGEVAQDGDNYSGMPIVEAARLAAAAKPGQTLANSVVRAVVGTRRSIRFRDVGKLQLKGIPEPLPTVEIVGDEEAIGVADTKPPPRKRGPLLALAAIVAVLVIAGAVALVTHGSSSHSSTNDSKPAAANYPVQLTKATCPADVARDVAGLTCSTLTVPEDRAKPDGRMVKLDVYRAPARTQPAAADPVLDFGADNLASSPARDYSDEYQLAGRGFHGEPGSSPSFACPAYAPIAQRALAKPSGDATEQQLAAAAFRDCYTKWTKVADLSQYNYLSEGDDMVDLIRALHLSHVNLVSGYLATISALEVTRELPGVVRSMTLQDAVPAGQSQYSDPTGTLSKAFNSYVALCKQNATCNKAYPDLPGALRHDYQVYSASPRIAHGDDDNGHRFDVLLDGPRVSEAVSSGLDDSTAYALLAAGIAARNRTAGVDDITADRVVLYNASDLDPTSDWGTQLSYNCSYEQYTVASGHTLSDQAVPELSGVDNGFLAWACKSWPVKKLPDIAFDDPQTDVPTLAVSGDLAPNSDQSWPDAFQQSLTNATVAQFPTLNAQVLANNVPACLADLRKRFLTNPGASLDVEACTSQSPPIQFVANG